MLSPLNEWLPVASWEVMRMFKRKDFLIATLLMPLLGVGAVFGINWFANRDTDAHRVALVGVGPGSELHAVQADALPPLEGFEWVADVAPSRERLEFVVNEREVAGALLIPDDLARADSVELMVRRGGGDWQETLEAHVLEQARLARARQAGLDDSALAQVDAPLPLSQHLTLPEARTSRGDRVVSAITIILIIVSLFTAVTYMGIGISGEKQARVTEVVISAIRPQAWIDGKIAAYTVIGLSQAATWAVSALIVALLVMRSVPPSVSASGVAITFVFAVVGFAFYTAFFALIMATIKDLQSTTKFQAYLIFIPFIPIPMMDSVLQNPESTWAIVMSQLPFFSPMLMPARWAISGAQPWELASAFVILVASLYFMRLAAGHAFRIAMLMYGKEITLPELWRWARSS